MGLPVEVFPVGTVKERAVAERDGFRLFAGVHKFVDDFKFVSGTELVGFVDPQPVVVSTFGGKGDITPGLIDYLYLGEQI